MRNLNDVTGTRAGKTGGRASATVPVAGLAGTIFGLGLAVSGMTDPAKVIGFLDLFGDWDPTLAFVMGGALLVAFPAFWWADRRRRPVLADSFDLPTNRSLDPRLLGGSALFGAGWGLSGLCPGPAVASLVTGMPQVFAFVAAMLAGMAAHRLILERPGAKTPARDG